MQIDIESLLISQEVLRDKNQIAEMMNYVSGGGFWTQEAIEEYSGRKSKLIAISRFPDGVLMLHDGHHRTISTFLAGRKHLIDSEFTIIDIEYEDYLEINLKNGWVTPFDPRTEVRLADFFDFKNKVLNMTEAAAIEYIKNNRDMYCKSRAYRGVNELIKVLKFS